MIAEVLAHLRPTPGDTIVDCTLGGGGHARAILEGLLPGGHLIGLDVDPVELPATRARLRDAGFGPEAFTAEHSNFRALPGVLASLGRPRVDGILIDLGVSSMQHDSPARGFSYKAPGPLDLRMDPTSGTPAWSMSPLSMPPRSPLCSVTTLTNRLPISSPVSSWMAGRGLHMRSSASSVWVSPQRCRPCLAPR